MEVDVDFGNYGILDVDVSVGGGIHPHSQHPKKSGCRPLTISGNLSKKNQKIYFQPIMIIYAPFESPNRGDSKYGGLDNVWIV